MTEQTIAEAVAQQVADLEPIQPRRRWRWLARNNAGLYVGGAILLLVFACALVPGLIATGDPLGINLGARLITPGTPGHRLGTDALGHDVLRLIVHGTRTSVLIAAVAVLFAAIFGVLLGLLSGYFGGWVDIVIMRWTDIQLSFPFILLALVVLALFGGGVENMILVLALGGWMDFARVVRSQVLSTKRLTYVSAAVAMGAGWMRILFRHLLPSVLSSIIVLLTLNLSVNILFEAALTFLGLGISPQTPTWGGMLSDGQVYMSSAWWVTTFPGLAIMMTALAINIVGDWLRDQLDPRLSGGR